MAWGDTEEISGGLFSPDKVVRENFDWSKTISTKGLFGNTPIATVREGFLGGTTVNTPSGNSESVHAPFFSGQSHATYATQHATQVAAGIDSRAASKSASSQASAVTSGGGSTGGGSGSYVPSYGGGSASHSYSPPAPAYKYHTCQCYGNCYGQKLRLCKCNSCSSVVECGNAGLVKGITNSRNCIRNDKKAGNWHGEFSIVGVFGILVGAIASVFTIYWVLFWLYALLNLVLKKTGEFVQAYSGELSTLAIMAVVSVAIYYVVRHKWPATTAKRTKSPKTRCRPLVVQMRGFFETPLGLLWYILSVLFLAIMLWWAFFFIAELIIAIMFWFLSASQKEDAKAVLLYLTLVPSAIVLFVPIKGLQID